MNRELFTNYVKDLINTVPHDMYVVMACVFVGGLLSFVVWKGFKKGVHYSLALLLLEYVFFIYSSTVLFRKAGKVPKYDFHPFWSYKAIREGRMDPLPENVMNVVVFIPVGLLLGMVFKGMTWWKALLAGLTISVSIESLQFLFMRGFSEFDDVMHNTIGCLMGFLSFQAFTILYRNKRVFHPLWLFCSYLFWPRRNKRLTS